MLYKLKLLFLMFAVSLGTQSAWAKEAFNLIGKIDYSRQRLVISNVEGILDKIYVRSGVELQDGQVLIDVTPFDPNLQRQQVVNSHSNLVVSEVLVREGERVERYQPILRLNSKDDMQIFAMSHYPTSLNLSIGQIVTVTFDPDGEQYQLRGKVDALHNHSVRHGKMSTVEAEIRIDNQSCFETPACANHYKIGSIVKLQFTHL